MSRPIFAANWKMHNGPSDAREFARSFLKLYARRSGRSIYIFPPAASLSVLAEELRDRPDINVGVQNIHWEDKGAFTGETSASIARDAGARLALVGHSERRHVFGETDEQTALKCAAAVRAGLTPMLCVGELLEEREAGQTEEVVVRQLQAALSGLEPESALSCLIAYEPVWAIGTGRTASPADASRVHSAIRSALGKMLGEKSSKMPILYGGSVNKGNVAELLAAESVDGVLVGGASLEASGWAAIANTD